jgi:hypothetical protein
MRNLLSRLFKLFLLLLLAPLFFSCAVETLLFLSSDLDIGSLDFFLIGFVSYVLLHGAILYAPGGRLYSNLQFIRTLRHELTHSIAGMFFGRRIDEMLVINPVGKTGAVISHVKYIGSSGLDSLITLAPYYLPLFTIPLLLLRFLTASWGRELVDFLIGLTLAFHYASLVDELLLQGFGLRQKDITHTGVIFSYAVIILFNLLFLALIKAVLHEHLPNAEYITGFLRRSWESYLFIFQQLRSLLPGG